MRILLLPLLLSACTPVAAVSEPTPERGSDKLCSADGLDAYVGREASQDLGAQMMEAAGAGTLRWVPVGGVMTMDYRPDRLNIFLDGQNRVEKVSCG